nr:MAG TPA: hypothetical protein [Caudoviricetes sp.]
MLTGVLGLALLLCLLGCTVVEKQVLIHSVGAYWEPGVFISRCNPYAA